MHLEGGIWMRRRAVEGLVSKALVLRGDFRGELEVGMDMKGRRWRMVGGLRLWALVAVVLVEGGICLKGLGLRAAVECCRGGEEG